MDVNLDMNMIEKHPFAGALKLLKNFLEKRARWRTVSRFEVSLQYVRLYKFHSTTYVFLGFSSVEQMKMVASYDFVLLFRKHENMIYANLTFLLTKNNI